tara:strand:- start:352 stop:663 length:312 start_codon:yes stop_codon:yes gene_type:complete
MGALVFVVHCKRQSLVNKQVPTMDFLCFFNMEQNMVLINRDDLKGMIRHMNRAVGYCKNARSSYPFDPQTDIEAEPTEFYSGASGFALGTLQSVIKQLEYSLE